MQIESVPIPVTPAPATKPSASDQNAAVIAGFLGWTLDAFDYFLVIYCLTAIGREFNRSDLEMAFSITVTLAFRPVGAFIFGLLADRYGRRLPLMLDLVFFSIIEVATAFAPNYTSFIILRALFGIGMGGEWGAGSSLVLEKVPARLRGLFGGLLMQGYSVGESTRGNVLFHIVPALERLAADVLVRRDPGLARDFRPCAGEGVRSVEGKRERTTGPYLRQSIFSHWKLFSLTLCC